MNGRQEWRNALRDSGLPSSTKLVGLTLDTYMGVDGVAWPSRKTIAASAGVSLRTVDRGLAHLKAAGLLAVRKGRGRGLVNLYQATLIKGVTSGNSETKKASQTTVKGVTRAPQKKSRSRTHARARAREPKPALLERVQVDEAMLALAKGWLTKQ